MARPSKTEHVKKICGCARWKDCAHPWYVNYREKDGNGLRRKLSLLVGREPVDFADAKDEARRAITAWKEGRDARNLLPVDAPTLTVADLLDAYGKRPGAGPIDRFTNGPAMKTAVSERPLGEWKAAEVSTETIKTFRRQRPIVAGNRDLAMLRAIFNWAVLEDLLPTTPFKKGTVSAVKLVSEKARIRTRRLQAGEAERLLLAAGGLHDLIVAALETGCRLGELLSLQWEQVRADHLFLPAGKTKAKKPRRVPVSTVLAAVLAGRRNDPAGEPMQPSDYVLGDAVGRRRRSIKSAWKVACKNAKITGLHFHDLRREAASRWLDAGVSLGTIQRWLGHANVAQTSTYLGASLGNDAEDMRAYEQAAGRLPQVAVNAGSNVSGPTSTDIDAVEKTNESAVVH